METYGVCRESGERARFTCTNRGNYAELNVFQDVLDCIQNEFYQEMNVEDQYMKGDIISRENKCRNINEQQMYNDIMKFCNMYKNVHGLLGSQNHCLTTEGMVNIIRIILQEYYKVVAELNSEDPVRTKSQNKQNIISLRGALVWSRQCVIILQHIVYILEKTKGLTGIIILNPLIDLLPHSNPDLNNITTKIFEGAAEAFCKMNWLWIIMGILNDPYDEFYVTKNDTNVKPSSWHMKYYLRKESIPKTTSYEMAKLIMGAGKMLNFLQVTCGETVPYTNARQYITNLQHEPYCGLLSLIKGDNGLNSYIYHLYKEYETMVLIVMKEKFSLVEYFYGVYWYIFLKLSNFGRYFIELIHPLHYHQVEKLRIDLFKKKLKRAVIATSPYTRKKRRIQEAKCIIASWKTTTSTDKLCDVLQINYDPGGPLKSIFYIYEPTYQKIFAFLWKKQHVQFSLCNQRKNLLYLMKKVPLEQWSSDCWRNLFRFVSIMMQFIYQLDYYFMYEIIEKEWNRFWVFLNHSKFINEVTDQYGQMLNNILIGTMQTEENKESRLFLNFFYTLVIDVEKLVENMEKKILDTNGYLADPMKCMADINILQNNFEEAVKEFIKLISSFNHNDALTALCDRINFNYYYKKFT